MVQLAWKYRWIETGRHFLEVDEGESLRQKAGGNLQFWRKVETKGTYAAFWGRFCGHAIRKHDIGRCDHRYVAWMYTLGGFVTQSNSHGLSGMKQNSINNEANLMAQQWKEGFRRNINWKRPIRNPTKSQHAWIPNRTIIQVGRLWRTRTHFERLKE